MTIPPTITLRAHSLAPTIGRDRNDLLPHGVTARITSRSGAVPARASLSSPSTARRTDQVRLATSGGRGATQSANRWRSSGLNGLNGMARESLSGTAATGRPS